MINCVAICRIVHFVFFSFVRRKHAHWIWKAEKARKILLQKSGKIYWKKNGNIVRMCCWKYTVNEEDVCAYDDCWRFLFLVFPEIRFSCKSRKKQRIYIWVTHLKPETLNLAERRMPLSHDRSKTDALKDLNIFTEQSVCVCFRDRKPKKNFHTFSLKIDKNANIVGEKK